MYKSNFPVYVRLPFLRICEMNITQIQSAEKCKYVNTDFTFFRKISIPAGGLSFFFEYTWHKLIQAKMSNHYLKFNRRCYIVECNTSELHTLYLLF